MDLCECPVAGVRSTGQDPLDLRKRLVEEEAATKEVGRMAAGLLDEERSGAHIPLPFGAAGEGGGSVTPGDARQLVGNAAAGLNRPIISERIELAVVELGA